MNFSYILLIIYNEKLVLIWSIDSVITDSQPKVKLQNAPKSESTTVSTWLSLYF